MESALLHTLQRFEWQFFGSQTFRSERLPEAVRLKMWHSFMRETASWSHVSPKKLIWALRMEHGESTGRLHFHFLLGNFPAAYHVRERAFAMMGVWQAYGGGITRVRPYKPVGDATGYIMKCLGIEGANLYEGRKFSKTSESVLISDACWRGVGLVRGSVASAAPTGQRQWIETESPGSPGGTHLADFAASPVAR